MSIPRCPHGNEGVHTADADPISIHADGTSCNCAVFAHDEPTATRAWAALCAPVTDERLREIVRECGFDGVVCLPDEYALDVARAVRDACEGKP